jgi:hypothetical protein
VIAWVSAGWVRCIARCGADASPLCHLPQGVEVSQVRQGARHRSIPWNFPYVISYTCHRFAIGARGANGGNEWTALSLGVVDSNVNLGDELTLVWGEENGGPRKTTVERHVPLAVRVKVAAAPYARDAREAYHYGWRSRAS